MKAFRASATLKFVLFGLLLCNAALAVDSEKSLSLTPDASVATAFLVAPGVLVTAHHAVRGREKIYIASERDSVFTAARVLGFSEELDVAVIQAAVEGEILTLGQWFTYPKGAESYVVGFPKIGQLVSEKRITAGIYNGDQSFGGRADWFQLSAEVHRGHSGSPVLGPDGKVYGLISHKLDARQVSDTYGDFPQNVNFALKSSELSNFLGIYGIDFASGIFEPSKNMRPYELFARYQDGIFLLLGAAQD